MKKSTLVVGASPYPFRYSSRAIQLLQDDGHRAVGLGKQQGEIHGIPIHTNKEDLENEDFDTISLYVNPNNQAELQDWILGLAPRRVIFNPGTENPPFEQKLQQEGIEVLEACTLVMLHTGQY